MLPPETFKVTRPVLLIVDDEPDNASSLCEFLSVEFRDVEVIAATSVDEGRRLVRSRRIDALLVDYRMPVQNGLEFLAEVRRTNPNLPAIIVTGLVDPRAVAEAAKRVHVEGIFVKPLDEAQLVRAVGRILGKNTDPQSRVPLQPTFGRQNVSAP